MDTQCPRHVPPTFLFCPGNRPERFDKALHSGAPAVIIDLEDSVPPQDKAVARAHALAWLTSASGRSTDVQIALRINDLFTIHGLNDVHDLVHTPKLPAELVIIVPKVASGRDLRWLRAMLAGRADTRFDYMALIESVEGLREARAIVEDGQPCALGFGAADLAAELGIDATWEALLPARWQMIAAAAGSRVPVLDVPTLHVKDTGLLLQECRAARSLGFSGKFAIHPSQVATIVSAFAPTSQEVEHARRIRDAFAASGGNACAIDGLMVDEPVYRAALRTLARGHAM